MSLVHDAVQVQIGGKHPWPDNVNLFQPYEAGQILLPDFAQCLSVKAFLKMCGLNFKTKLRTNAENMSPSGKVPFIQVGPFLVSELDPIIGFVQTKGHHLSAELSDCEKAEMRAYMALIESIIVNAELYFCWCEEDNLEKVTKPRYGYGFPWPLSRLLPWKRKMEVKERMTSIGWGGKTVDEVCEDVRTCCQALSERLGDGKYFFGQRPTELDAMVYGHLFAILTTILPNPKLSEVVESFKNLSAYCQNIDDAFFKNHEH